MNDDPRSRQPHAAQKHAPAGPAEVLQRYFEETMAGDLDGAVDRWFVTEPDYVLISDEPAADISHPIPWAGRQVDRAGIKRAYGRLLDALEVIDSQPGTLIEHAEQVAVTGTFVYRARATGRTARSTWAATATVRDRQIISYRFIEDSAAVSAALPASASDEPA